MPDPFEDVDAAPAEMIEIIATALETRAADPSMIPVLDALSVPDGGLIVDIGSGTGGITRRIADRFPSHSVLGLEPSTVFTNKAKELAGGCGLMYQTHQAGAESYQQHS